MKKQIARIHREEYAFELLKTQIMDIVGTAKEFKRIRAEKGKKGEEVIKDIPPFIWEFIDLAADIVCDENGELSKIDGESEGKKPEETAEAKKQEQEEQKKEVA